MELFDLSTLDTGEYVRDLSSDEVNIIDGPLFTNFAIVAVVDASGVGSVRVDFYENGVHSRFAILRRNFRTENNSPYALCDDDGGTPVKYEKCVFLEGIQSFTC